MSKPLKVLMIGNSFSICVLKQMPQVAANLGCDLHLVSLYIGGCSLEKHWNNCQTPDEKPYRVTDSDHNDVEGNIPEWLAKEPWDIVTIQQASHFSWRPETFEPFAANLIGLIRKLAPTAEIVVQETWSYTPYDHRLADWGITPEKMYEELHKTYFDFAKGYGFRVIPTGTAVQRYRETLPVDYSDGTFGNGPCGNPETGDNFHLNKEGEYLQALVWTGKLFGVDVSQCTYTPDFGEDFASIRAPLMRKIAAEVLR